MIGSAVAEGNQRRHAAPLDVFAANEMSRSFRGDQCRIDAVGRSHLPEVDVETVRAHQQVARLQVRLDVVAEQVALHFVRKQHIDEIARFGRFVDRHRIEPVADGQVVIRTPLALPHDHIAAAVPKVLRLRVSLAAVAEDGNRLVFEERKVGVVVVIDGDWHGGVGVKEGRGQRAE